MAKRTVSFADYQEPTWEEYTGEDPPANKWYTGVVKNAKYLEDDDQVMFIIEITEGDFQGWGKALYCPLSDPERMFLIQELLKALQDGKAKDVTLDWESDAAVNAWLKKQKPIKFKTREYNGDIKVGKTRALLEAVPGTNAPNPAPEPPVADDDEVEPYTEAELAEYSAEDLEGILKEEYEYEDADMPAKPRRDPKGEKYTAALVKAILEEQEADEGEGEGEGDQDADDGADGDGEFDDGFDGDGDGTEADPEPDPEPEPAPRARRSRTAAPSKAAPAKAAAPTARRRRS